MGMTVNAHTMPRYKRGHAIEAGQVFLRGEYVLSRRMRRWLEPRCRAATHKDAVYLAALRLAQFILQHHAHPEKIGRDFYLCRESLPACFPKHEDGTPLYSEWHLRLAKAVLLKIGFIERVTPVAERRFFRFTDKTTGEVTRREGRWLPAVRQHTRPGRPKSFRAPKVFFKFATITLRLLGSPSAGDRVPPRSPEYKGDHFRNAPKPYEGRDGIYSGERPAVNSVDPDQAAHLAILDARRRAVRDGHDPFGGRKLGDFLTRRER